MTGSVARSRARAPVAGMPLCDRFPPCITWPSWPCPTSSPSTSPPRRRSSATSRGALRVHGVRRRAPGACRRRRASRSTSRTGSTALAEADTVLVPGLRPAQWPPPAAALDALRAAHARGARVVSICTGAFVLAARRPARRPPRHDALGLRRAAGRALSRRSPSTPTSSTSTRATSSPRPASPRASTSACTSCAATTAPRWPTPSRGGSSWRRTATAGRRSSSSRPLPAADERGLEADARVGARAPARAARRSAAHGAPRGVQRAHLRAPLPRRDGHHAAAVAAAPARRCTRGGCSRPPTCRSRTSPTRAGFGTAASLRAHFRRATATTPARVSPQPSGVARA